MKRKIKVFIVILAVLLTTVLITNYVHATSDNTIDIDVENITNEENSIEEIPDLEIPDSEISASEISDSELPDSEEYYIKDDLIKIDESINVEKIIDGNTFLIGNKVSLDGSEIIGNAYIIANEVTIENGAIVDAPVYIIANKINLISGYIYDAYFIAEEVNIYSDFQVDRDAKIIAEEINLDGTIERNLYCLTETLNLKGTIGNKLIYSGNLNGDTSNIESVEKIEVNEAEVEVSKAKIISSTIISILTKIFTVFIIALLIIDLIEQSLNFIDYNESDKTSYKNEKTAFDLKSVVVDILKGFVCLIIVPIIAIICMITGIGTILGIILVLIYILILLLANAVACFEIAKMFEIKAKSKGMLVFLVSVLSAGIYAVLLGIKYIPVLGGFISFIVFLYGISKIIFFIIPNKENKLKSKEVIAEEEKKQEKIEENIEPKNEE